MQKWILTLTALFVFTYQAAAGSLGLFGAYWDPSDADSEIGFGAKLNVLLSPTVALEIRGSYFEFEESTGGTSATLEVIPIEAALLYMFAGDDVIRPYVGGGVGYYLLDLEWSSPAGSMNPDVDDEVGFFAVGGAAFKISDRFSLFAEAKYIWLEMDTIEGMAATGDDDLSGFGANVGLLLRW